QAYCDADGSNDVAIPSARCSEGYCWSTIHTHQSSSVEIISISVVDCEHVNACIFLHNVVELQSTTLTNIGHFYSPRTARTRAVTYFCTTGQRILRRFSFITCT